MGSCQSIQTTESKVSSKQKGKPQIILKSFTWARDSHGLFDYESKTLSKKTMKSQIPGILVRKGNEILLNKENDQINPSTDRELLNMHIRDGNYWVSSCINSVKKGLYEEDHEDNQNSMWLVVKSFKPNGANKPGYKLNEGDLLKLGRIKFRIKELRSSGASPGSKKYNPDAPEKHAKTEEEDAPMNEIQRKNSKGSNPADSRTSTAQTCRICLGEQADAEDPFFSPCHCAGTMKYIHVLCLQRWLKSKLHTKQTGFSISVYWKTLECELCKKTFPTSFEIDGKKYDIIEIERPDCGYLMMEILSKEKNILRGIHIIKMEGKSNIKLGRGHDSDIRITDISVSRCHAIIKLDKGNFYIEDNNSKFGTLVHLRKPFPLVGDYNNISLQIGRTVLSLSAKKNWKSFSCFGNGQVSHPEIEDDLFGGRAVTGHTEGNIVNSRHPSHIENEPNLGQIDNENEVRDERDLPSPIHQGGEEGHDHDDLSHSGDEELHEGNIPENPDQINLGQALEDPVAPNQAPGEQQANGVQQNGQPNEELQVENLDHNVAGNPPNQVAA